MFACLADPIQCAIGAIPRWAWWVLTGCALLFVIGLALNLGKLAQAVAGWWGVAAVVGGMLTAFAVLWPKRRKVIDPLEQLHEDSPDAAPSLKRPKRKQKSLLGRPVLPWNRP